MDELLLEEIIENGHRALRLVESLDKVSDAKKVFSELDRQDKRYMGNHYIDSDSIVYRKVKHIDGKSVGYCELYDSELEGQAKGDVNIAIVVKKEYRGRGIASELIRAAIDWFKGNSKYKTMSYIIDKTNAPSRSLAVKCGFKYATELANNEQLYMIEKRSDKLNIIFYHGANEIYKDISPVSPNMGNKLEPPKWVTYMWDNRRNALHWAAQRAVSKRLMDLTFEDDRYRILKSPYTLGNADKSISCYILASQYEQIKALCTGLSCYIYYIKINPKSLGVGHDRSLDEYTSTDKHPKVINIEQVKLTNKLFDEIFTPVSDSQRKKDFDVKTHSNRGDLAGLMYDQSIVYSKESYIIMKRRKGTIKTGEDMSSTIDQFLEYQKLFSKFSTILELAQWICDHITIDDSLNQFIWPQQIIKTEHRASSFDIAVLYTQYADTHGLKNNIGRICCRCNGKQLTKEVALVYMNDRWNVILDDTLIKGLILKGNSKMTDTLDLYKKAYIRSLKDQGYTVTDDTSQLMDNTKYGHFERKYLHSTENLDKQKIIDRLFD